MTRRRVHYSTFRCDVGHRRYYVTCRIILGRSPSHAGPDSPRFLDPGLPSTLEVIRVRRDGLQITPDKDLKAELLSRCSRMAGIRRSSMAVPQDQQVMEFTA
jgi:hypothetical protein